MRGKSWTRQTVSDACDTTNWDSLCGTPCQMVAPEVRLTKKVTTDKEGAGPALRSVIVERIPETEPRRFYVLSADIEAHGQTGGCPGCAALASYGRAIKLHNDECRERVRTIIERTLTGRARMNAYKDTETERMKEKKRPEKRMAGRQTVAFGEKRKVQRMCLWNLGKMSRWRIDMRSHLARRRTDTKRTE